MKALLVVDVPMTDENKHICNFCPIWNDEKYICQYGYRMFKSRCPLKPIPKKHENVPKMEYELGWNDCIEEIEG